MQKSPEAFRTIGEVATWLGVPTHVLRFWESKFAQVKPVKRAGGRRYYRRGDMALLGGIKVLLKDHGMTIKGVQRILSEDGASAVTAHAPEIDDEVEAADELPEAELPEGEPRDRANGSPVPEASADEVEATSVPAVRRPRIERPDGNEPAEEEVSEPSGAAVEASGPAEAEERPAAGADGADAPRPDVVGEPPSPEPSSVGEHGGTPLPDVSERPAAVDAAATRGATPPAASTAGVAEATRGDEPAAGDPSSGGHEGDAPEADGPPPSRSNGADPAAVAEAPEAEEETAASAAGNRAEPEPADGTLDPAGGGTEAEAPDGPMPPPAAGVAPGDHVEAERVGDGAAEEAAVAVPDDGAVAGASSGGASAPGPSAGAGPSFKLSRLDGNAPASDEAARGAQREPTYVPEPAAADSHPPAEAPAASHDAGSERVLRRRSAANGDGSGAADRAAEEVARGDGAAEGGDGATGRTSHDGGRPFDAGAARADGSPRGERLREVGGAGVGAAVGVMVAERDRVGQRPAAEAPAARIGAHDAARSDRSAGGAAERGPLREATRPEAASSDGPGASEPEPSAGDAVRTGEAALPGAGHETGATGEPQGAGEGRSPDGGGRRRTAVAAVPPCREDEGRAGRRPRPHPAAVRARNGEVLVLVRRLEAVRDRMTGP